MSDVRVNCVIKAEPYELEILRPDKTVLQTITMHDRYVISIEVTGSQCMDVVHQVTDLVNKYNSFNPVDALAGTYHCAGIESYGGRSPESIVFSGWVVLAVLIAWTVLIGIFGVFKLVEWMGQ